MKARNIVKKAAKIKGLPKIKTGKKRPRISIALRGKRRGGRIGY